MAPAVPRAVPASPHQPKVLQIPVGRGRCYQNNRSTPESHRISQQTIKIKSAALSTTNAWQARKDVIFPLKANSMCALRRQRDEHKSPTLGIFKPGVIKRLRIKPSAADWTQAEREIMRQGDLFESESPEELEKIPFDFSYEFRCVEPTCKGHTMKCTDWEMGESWRKWKHKYGDQWEEKFRQKYETYMVNERDTPLLRRHDPSASKGVDYRRSVLSSES